MTSATSDHSPLFSACKRCATVIFVALFLSTCGDSKSSEPNGPVKSHQNAVLTRGPQLALASTYSMVVAWRTDLTTIGVVEFDSGDGLVRTVKDSTPSTEHVLSLSGLAPDTRYSYRLRSENGVISAMHQFRTVPADPDAHCRFVAFGDSGSGTQDQLDVAAQIAKSAPDLAILTGDVVYVSGSEHELDPRYFLPYQNLIEHIPFYPSLGNHDVATDAGRPLLNSIYLPISGAKGGRRYYSFDRGAIHFVALNTNEAVGPGSTQYAWLEEDLATTSATWIIVFFHHPPYSSSSHRSDLAVRSRLCPVFERHSVDIVFNGHDHNYERSYPMAAEKVVDAKQEPAYTNPSGPVYVVTGGGGQYLYPSGKSSFTAFSESAFHHVQVDIKGRKLSLKAIRSDGTLMDRMSIDKQ